MQEQEKVKRKLLVQARHKDLEQMKKRMQEEKKLKLRERLQHVKTANATQKD